MRKPKHTYPLINQIKEDIKNVIIEIKSTHIASKDNLSDWIYILECTTSSLELIQDKNAELQDLEEEILDLKNELQND